MNSPSLDTFFLSTEELLQWETKPLIQGTAEAPASASVLMSSELCAGMYFICLLELRNDTNTLNPFVSIYIFSQLWLALLLPLWI